MQPAFWPQKTMLPRLFRAELDKAGSLPVPQFRARPVRVKWQFLFGICTKKPARRARDRWWLVLRLACELQRASLCHAPAVIRMPIAKQATTDPALDAQV